MTVTRLHGATTRTHEQASRGRSGTGSSLGRHSRTPGQTSPQSSPMTDSMRERSVSVTPASSSKRRAKLSSV